MNRFFILFIIIFIVTGYFGAFGAFALVDWLSDGHIQWQTNAMWAFVIPVIGSVSFFVTEMIRSKK